VYTCYWSNILVEVHMLLLVSNGPRLLMKDLNVTVPVLLVMIYLVNVCSFPQLSNCCEY